MIWVAEIFLWLGIVFSIMGNLGVLIFPDVYTRLHASSTCSTTSVFSIFIAIMLRAGISPLTGKVLLITIFFLVSSPVASYIIARYAWHAEIPVWRKLKSHGNAKRKRVGIVDVLRKYLADLRSPRGSRRLK